MRLNCARMEEASEDESSVCWPWNSLTAKPTTWPHSNWILITVTRLMALVSRLELWIALDYWLERFQFQFHSAAVLRGSLQSNYRAFKPFVSLSLDDWSTFEWREASENNLPSRERFEVKTHRTVTFYRRQISDICFTKEHCEDRTHRQVLKSRRRNCHFLLFLSSSFTQDLFIT